LAIVALNIDRGLIDQYAKAGAITIEGKNKPIAHMRLPNAAKAVQALAACERGALERWKVDTAALATLQRRATSKKSMSAYMSDHDYPAEALSKREQGTTVVRLTVDADGKVPECGVVSSSGSRTLDLQTCAIFIRRVQYDPAISAEGRPVRSVVFTRLTWRLM
jgi:TonB family protein